MRNLVLAFLISVLPVLSFSKTEEEHGPDMYIDCVMDGNAVYERQPASVVVTLFSSTPDVEFANVIKQPTLNKGEFATKIPVDYAGNAYRKRIDGRDYYCFPLEAFVFTMADKGSYELRDGKYKIGIAIPVIVNDPFWGKIRSSEVKEYDIPVNNLSFKVKALPKPSSDVNFSGSVGHFSIETVIPRGDIFVNEEATAVIVLRGKGMIAESTMPEYRDAFKSGLKLKSVSESRTASYENGEMVSELHLECTFIPSRTDDVEIGEVTFDYFDPTSGKYVKARSNPVKINVKSTVSKRDSMSV